MKTPKTGYCWVARKHCGCIVAAVTDDDPRVNAHQFARKWYREGYLVERVPDEYVRKNFMGHKCPHKPEQKGLFE